VSVIYAVVPPEAGESVYERLVGHYKDNPNIKVIWERRRSERRAVKGATGDHGEKRELRDRRNRRLPGGYDVSG
jgi:hypothetical protein